MLPANPHPLIPSTDPSNFTLRLPYPDLLYSITPVILSTLHSFLHSLSLPCLALTPPHPLIPHPEPAPSVFTLDFLIHIFYPCNTSPTILLSHRPLLPSYSYASFFHLLILSPSNHPLISCLRPRCRRHSEPMHHRYITGGVVVVEEEEGEEEKVEDAVGVSTRISSRPHARARVEGPDHSCNEARESPAASEEGV